MTGVTSSIWPGASPDASRRLPAGRMEGARSSPWPTSKRMRGARPPAKRNPALSDRDQGFAREPQDAFSGATDAEPASGRGPAGLYARAARQLSVGTTWPGVQLHLEAVGELHAFPGGRTRLSLRSLRGIALGRKSWLFCGSNGSGWRAASMYSLIITALCRARHRAGLIEIGDVSRRHPSHTTGHTGPYHGGSIGLSRHRQEDSGETKGVEHMISKGVLNRRVSGHAPESRR